MLTIFRLACAASLTLCSQDRGEAVITDAGMIMITKQILERTPDPTEHQIREGLDGNLCRCTGYQHIVNAVRTAAKATAQA